MAGRQRDLTVRWREGMVFEAVAEGRPPVRVDGDSAVAVSPVELLLVAAATCTASDVVSILLKQRVELTSLEVKMSGTRRDEHPRRFTAIQFGFTLAGAGADEVKARRAIDLSLEKYCSVVKSLASDIRISYDVVVR